MPRDERRYSSYNHPYQLDGELFKVRTYATEAAMDKAAAKIYAEGKHPVPGYPLLYGYRHFKPQGMQRALYLIKTYYPPAVPLDEDSD